MTLDLNRPKNSAKRGVSATAASTYILDSLMCKTNYIPNTIVFGCEAGDQLVDRRLAAVESIRASFSNTQTS